MKIMNDKNKHNRKFVFIGSDDISWSLFQNYNHMALGSFFIDVSYIKYIYIYLIK